MTIWILIWAVKMLNSPHVLITGMPLNYNNNLYLQFGQYCKENEHSVTDKVTKLSNGPPEQMIICR